MLKSSLLSGRILLNFKRIHALKIVPVTRKNEEDPIKNIDARVVTTLSIKF